MLRNPLLSSSGNVFMDNRSGDINVSPKYSFQNQAACCKAFLISTNFHSVPMCEWELEFLSMYLWLRMLHLIYLLFFDLNESQSSGEK